MRTILVPAAALALLLVPPTVSAGTFDAPAPAVPDSSAPDPAVPEGCTITGTAGDDVLEGTGAADVICGLTGDDQIFGKAGADTLKGGGGNDTIDGGNGNDRIYGNDGDDSMLGSAGADALYGGGGSDYANGGDGKDNLYGNYDDDNLKGGGEDDTFFGGLGSDWCRQNRGTGKRTSCEWPNPLLTCPVANGTVYDNFGADRGDHKHQGNDIDAKKGEPVLATFRGKTENARASGAGLYVKLTRADGSFTYGMHLSKFAKERRVGVGDVIGFVGSSGNAGTDDHLHFEWHPDGGDAIDPFPYLSKVCKDARAPLTDAAPDFDLTY